MGAQKKLGHQAIELRMICRRLTRRPWVTTSQAYPNNFKLLYYFQAVMENKPNFVKTAQTSKAMSLGVDNIRDKLKKDHQAECLLSKAGKPFVRQHRLRMLDPLEGRELFAVVDQPDDSFLLHSSSGDEVPEDSSADSAESATSLFSVLLVSKDETSGRAPLTVSMCRQSTDPWNDQSTFALLWYLKRRLPTCAAYVSEGNARAPLSDLPCRYPHHLVLKNKNFGGPLHQCVRLADPATDFGLDVPLIMGHSVASNIYALLFCADVLRPRALLELCRTLLAEVVVPMLLRLYSEQLSTPVEGSRQPGSPLRFVTLVELTAATGWSLFEGVTWLGTLSDIIHNIPMVEVPAVAADAAPGDGDVGGQRMESVTLMVQPSGDVLPLCDQWVGSWWKRRVEQEQDERGDASNGSNPLGSDKGIMDRVRHRAARKGWML